MTRHPYDHRTSSPAVQRARDRLAALGIQSRATRDVEKPGGVDIDLNVRVEDLEETGVDIDENLPAAWVTALLDDGKTPRWTARGDGHVTVNLERESAFVRVQGELDLKLSHPCVRCLNDVPFDIHMDVDLRLVERTGQQAPEGEWSEGDADGDDFEGTPMLGDASDLEDLDIASYEGGMVKVGELLREQLFLELPMHPACDSPRAKPEKPCAFDEKAANTPDKEAFTASRWAGLASLRDKLPAAPSATTKQDAKKDSKMTNKDGKHELPKADDNKPSSKVDWNKAESVYASKGDASLSKTARIPAFSSAEEDEDAARKADALRDDGVDGLDDDGNDGDEAGAEPSEAETIVNHAIALPARKTPQVAAYGVRGANDDESDAEPTVPMEMPKAAKPAKATKPVGKAKPAVAKAKKAKATKAKATKAKAKKAKAKKPKPKKATAKKAKAKKAKPAAKKKAKQKKR